ncbi:MAG: hypothetical protein ACLQVX_15090 [Limisphaerales bacterium]
MKKIGLILSLVLTLGGSAMAHCCCHFWGFWPSFSVGVGVGGIGCSVGGCSCYCYGCGCGYPAYSYPACGYAYSQPAYTYSYVPAASYADPQATVAPASAPAPSAWVPSTRGTGQWVPDPAPYRYTPPVNASRPADAKATLRQVVTSTCSPEGIPVYTIGYVK